MFALGALFFGGVLGIGFNAQSIQHCLLFKEWGGLRFSVSYFVGEIGGLK